MKACQAGHGAAAERRRSAGGELCRGRARAGLSPGSPFVSVLVTRRLRGRGVTGLCLQSHRRRSCRAQSLSRASGGQRELAQTMEMELTALLAQLRVSAGGGRFLPAAALPSVEAAAALGAAPLGPPGGAVRRGPRAHSWRGGRRSRATGVPGLSTAAGARAMRERARSRSFPARAALRGPGWAGHRALRSVRARDGQAGGRGMPACSAHARAAAP